MDYLIEITSDGARFTERELRDEVDTFIIAVRKSLENTEFFKVYTFLGFRYDGVDKLLCLPHAGHAQGLAGTLL